MKRRDKKLELHRETLHLLETRQVDSAELRRLVGYSPQTSETVPCCGGDPETVPCCGADPLTTVITGARAN